MRNILSLFFASIILNLHASHGFNTNSYESSSSVNKLDVTLKSLVGSTQSTKSTTSTLLTKTNDTNLYVVMRTADVEKTKAFLKSNGCTIGTALKTADGGIITATIQVSLLAILTSQPEVQRIESSKKVKFDSKMLKQHPSDGSIRYTPLVSLTKADVLHTGINSDNYIYRGDSVLIGIIDSGIDYLHPDFGWEGDSSRTRIYSIWDQNSLRGTPPQLFSYGSEWKREQIRNAVAYKDTSIVPTLDVEGHGTHVAGIAAGSGNLKSDYMGIAPNADIVMVSLDQFNSTKILDAAHYIFSIADSLNRPVVINMSLGFDDERTDGTSLIDYGLTQMVEARKGRVLVAAAGNSGGEKTRWMVRPSIDTLQFRKNFILGSTFFQVPGHKSAAAIVQLQVSASDIDKVSLCIELDSIIPYRNNQDIVDSIRTKPHARTPIRRLRELMNQQSDIIDELRYIHGSSWAATVQWTVAVSSDPKYLTVQLAIHDTLDEEPSYLMPFVKGYDLFNIAIRTTGEAILVHTPYGVTEVSNVRGLPTNPNDGQWNDNFTVSSPASAHGVIAVGSYNHRINYYQANGRIGVHTYSGESGELSDFSSVGPSLDGRMKPEICAPGGGVISALAWNRYDTEMSNDPTPVVLGRRHLIASGTSMSSPVVAGGIALYLQKHKNSSYSDIRDAITTNAVTDSFTNSHGILPNVYWGYGMFDISTFMFGKPTSVATDENDTFTLAPNPAHQYLIVRGNMNQEKRYSIYSLLGERIVSGTIDNDSRIDVSGLPSGTYYVTCDGMFYRTSQSFVIQR